ncbi:MAG TPA: SPOR domain-containing protein [Vicinamibacterales bacterium]|nr:SPOR domain-containing protein [Vicinamibacterales bacterium]
MASHIEDDGFHEIQLNGKQLVFLFMAATVVSVVIFLCGVLVGRGVRAERGAVADLSVSSVADPTPQPAAQAPAPTPSGSDPTAAAQPPAAGTEDLSDFDRPDKSKPAKEEVKSGASASQPPPQAQAQAPSRSAKDTAVRETPKQAPPKEAPAPKEAPRAAAPPPPPARAEAESTTGSEPTGSGYAVQIAALNVRGEAEAIAKRLSSKGYAAYVVSPASGTPSVFRVRVGKFTTRREAESVAAKLQKEEQYKPWVTR